LSLTSSNWYINISVILSAWFVSVDSIKQWQISIWLLKTFTFFLPGYITCGLAKIRVVLLIGWLNLSYGDYYLQN
jgi:hypothetical protein